jgi:hypothetical protein
VKKLEILRLLEFRERRVPSWIRKERRNENSLQAKADPWDNGQDWRDPGNSQAQASSTSIAKIPRPFVNMLEVHPL